VNLTRDLQLFGSLTGVSNSTRSGSGHTYWQFGGGTQTRVMDRGLWLRAEALTSRNVDLVTDRERPQQTFSFGLNGEVARNTAVAINVYADRVQGIDGLRGESWLTRSSIRVTRTFPGASHRQTLALSTSMARHGGTGSVVGLVFTDWNGNGQQDPDEFPVENIPVRLANLGHTSTSRAGEFAFMDVPIGMLQVGIDLMSLPVDFDTPAVPYVHVELQRGETRRLVFGLTPLGSITGRVVRDRNGNGQVDEGDEAVSQAVLTLDGGVRTEPVRHGEFRFDAVRSGTHTVELLAQSLPEGGRIIGEPSMSVTIDRNTLAPTVTYLVVIEPRPEIRRVFPSDQTQAAKPTVTPASPPARSSDGAPRSAAPVRPSETASARPRSTPAPAKSTPAPPVTREGATPSASKVQFAIQITAVNDPLRAADIIEQLRKEGYSAYLVLPPTSDPDAPYKVRVGFYATRAEADQEARVLEKRRKEKVWVVRER
jgi:cell division septation protein DedD